MFGRTKNVERLQSGHSPAADATPTLHAAADHERATSSMRIKAQERPWVVCAVFLLFTLISLFEEKNGSQWVESNQSEVMAKPSLLGGALPMGHVEERHGEINKGKYSDPDNDAPVISLEELPPVPPTSFNFCTEPQVHSVETNHSLPIIYQCDGPRYRSFVASLRSFVADLVTEGEQPPSWGHRTSLPPDRRYLFIGNSHTRQVTMELLCQMTVLSDDFLDPRNLAMARRYHLDNGSTVYLVVNSDVVHSPRWVDLLSEQINVSLTDFDAVVLGTFNRCQGEDLNTTFARDMLNATNSDNEIDCNVYDGPTLKEFAAVYPGPLLYVSMFASYRFNTFGQDLIDAKHLRLDRPNLMAVEARHYIKDYKLQECGSAKRDNLSDCTEGVEARRHHHRCVGPYGGHPDLIAWDIVEFLHRHA